MGARHTIEIHEVCKTFHAADGGGVQALDGVSLRIEQGEFVSVVGASGSGKSTLLLTIGGLVEPTSGRVVLGGRAVYDLDEGQRAALRRTRVGLVLQTFNLVPFLTMLENVMLPGLLARRDWAEAESAAMGLIDRLGLVSRCRHRPAQLTVGERKRAGIARSLVNVPSVILADEPTAGLDPGTAAQVMGLFRQLNDEGQTVVIATPDLDVAHQTLRIVRLRTGAIVADHPTLRRLVS